MATWEYNRYPDPVLGPFVLQEWALADHLTAVRNLEYESWASRGQPYLDAVILRWIDSSEEGIELLRKGELDLVWDVAEVDLFGAEGWPGVKVSHPPSTGTERLVLNLRNPKGTAPCPDSLRRSPAWPWALGDPRVREAIDLSINRAGIVKALFQNLGTPAAQLVGKGIVGYNDTLTPTPYDLDRAKSLIDDARAAGVPVDRQIRLIGRTGQFPKINETIENIQYTLSKIGLDVKIENGKIGYRAKRKVSFKYHGED